MKRLASNIPLTELEAINISATNLYAVLKECENAWLEPEEIANLLCEAIRIKKGLDEYTTAKREGRLLVLPKTLYEADPTPLIMGVIEWKVTGVRYYDGAVRAYTVQTENVQSIIYEREIGKTVFFTRAEAESVLKEGINNDHYI